MVAIYFSTPSIFSRLSTMPSMRIITRRGKKTRPSRPSLSRPASSSLSAAVTLNRSRCSRRRRARLRARTLRWYRSSCSSARGSARVIRARRSDNRARGRSEKYESFAREACVSSRWESVEITVCVRARQAGGVETHVRVRGCGVREGKTH